MAENNDKLWPQNTLNDLSLNRAREEIQRTGRALPCTVKSISGQIVTVTVNIETSPFTLPPLSVPIETSVYDWIPFQVGDQGWIKSADASLGAVSGLGAGTPTLTNPGNLTALVFSPIANASWTAPGGDASKRVLQGANGVLLQSVGNAVSGKFDKSSGIALTFGTTSVTLASSGVTISAGGKTWTFTSAGFTDSDGNIEETHVHLYTPGSGTPTDTGPPVG